MLKLTTLIAAVAFTFAVSTVQAGVTCNTYGNTTYCSGTDSNGNYYSYSCTTYGNSTSCN